jgi:Concanavalin A-like lectin/glucanases superfamily
MIMKYFLIGFLFWVWSIASAQVMLPAYQGVFNAKMVVAGSASNALDFDGVNDYVLNNSLAIDPSLGFTIEGWMKIRDLRYSALATQTVNQYPAPFDMYVLSGNGRLAFLVGQNSVTGNATGATPLTIGTWTHAAFVYDPTIAKVIIYVNGVQDGIGDAAPPGNVAGSKFMIGNRYDMYTGLYGTLDDVRIWNVVRTQSQIQANMNNELVGNETGLVAYYSFNQGVAGGNNTAITTAIDKTANALNGTLTNFSLSGATSNFVVGKVQSIANGLTLATASTSAYAIKQAYPSSVDGVYWIDLPNVGPTQIYCIMNSAVKGGGWMLAMKATRGTTFNYDANYWTTINTLNPTDNTRNDGDAKYMFALWPDIPSNYGSSKTGGSINLSATYNNWSWLQNDFDGGTRITPISFFASANNLFISDAELFAGKGTAFSSQTDIRFYGFNYTQAMYARTRWGFAWNENGGGLYPNGEHTSNDVSGGIGLDYISYSAGDFCPGWNNYWGINRSARVEIYIR